MSSHGQAPLTALSANQSTRHPQLNKTRLASYKRYYLTSTSYAQTHPQVLKVGYEQLDKTGSWIKANPREAAQVLSPLWGNLGLETVEIANAHHSYQEQPIKIDWLGEQQKISDAFFATSLLPKAVDAKDVGIWKP